MNASRTPAPQGEALEILGEDHRAIEQLFSEFEVEDNRAERHHLVRELCGALLQHAQLETEIFYPAVRRLLDDTELVDDAQAEHDVIANLVAELQDAGPTDPELEATMALLRDAVENHFEQEEGDIFPRIESTGADLQGLADRLLERRSELASEYRDAPTSGDTDESLDADEELDLDDE